MSHHPADMILRYLKDRMPGYPFDITVDVDFVDELLEDFPNANVPEEIKAFRWHHNNQPAARVSNLRIALRRWIANSKTARR